MPDFIEVYEDVLSAEQCQSLINLLQDSEHKTLGTIQGKTQVSEASIQELSLNDHPKYELVVQQLSTLIVPYLLQYFNLYYQVLIAGVGFTVYHPTTKEIVDLTTDNFEEVGRPQIGILVTQLFRLGMLRLHKSEAENAVATIFHSESYPQKHNDDALHRILNIELSLQDVPEGGLLEFYEFDRKIPAKRGRLVIFPSYFTHAHRQTKPISQDKYQISTWLLFKQTKQLYSTSQAQ